MFQLSGFCCYSLKLSNPKTHGSQHQDKGVSCISETPKGQEDQSLKSNFYPEPSTTRNPSEW